MAVAEARRIADELAAGRTRRDVAAADGTSAATVCRRLKALSLVPAMAEALGRAAVPARTLAAVASWPAAVQERAARRVAEAVRKTGRFNSKAAAAVFDATARPVRRASWVFAGEAGAARFARCANCPSCSGNRPGLFDAAGAPLDGADAAGRGARPWRRRSPGRAAARAKRRGPRATWAYVSWDGTRHVAVVHWGRAPA